MSIETGFLVSTGTHNSQEISQEIDETTGATVTVYSKPNCVQCKATYRALDQQNIDYKKVDITEDADALNLVKNLGYLQAPVVLAGEEHWSGFRPDRIEELAKRLKAASKDLGALAVSRTSESLD